MSQPDRRGFLRNLAALPLIGGGVTLIGSPTAAAEPVTARLLETYGAWLHFERQMLRGELAKLQGWRASDAAEIDFITVNNPGRAYHRSVDPAVQPQPSSRAAIILSAAGCPW